MVVAGVDDENVGIDDLAAGQADGGENLLVDSMVEAQIGAVAKHLDVVHHRHVRFAFFSRPRTMDFHHEGQDRRVKGAIGKLTDLAAIEVVDVEVKVESLPGNTGQLGGQKMFHLDQLAESPAAIESRRLRAGLAVEDESNALDGHEDNLFSKKGSPRSLWKNVR